MSMPPVRSGIISLGKFFLIFRLYYLLSKKMSASDFLLFRIPLIELKRIKKKCSMKNNSAINVTSDYFFGALL